MQQALVTAAEQRQGAMRGNRQEGFGVGKIVLELGGLDFLAGDERRFHEAMRLEVAAQLAEQGGVFRKPFHQNLAGAVEHASDVAEAGVGVDEAFGLDFRGQQRVGEQGFGEWCETGFPGGLRLAAPLRLVRQIKIFEALLGVCGVDCRCQLRAQLALLVNRGEDRSAPVFEFAQVGQAFVEQAQLDVVESPGNLLAIAGDERHRGAFVEQGGGGQHLLRATGHFCGNLFCNLLGNTGFDRGRHERAQVGGFEKGRTMQNRQAKLKNTGGRQADCIAAVPRKGLNCQSWAATSRCGSGRHHENRY